MADDHFILLKIVFKARSQEGPPIAFDVISHDLNYNDIVMRRRMSVSPPTFCRRSRKARNAPELFGQLFC